MTTDTTPELEATLAATLALAKRIQHAADELSKANNSLAYALAEAKQLQLPHPLPASKVQFKKQRRPKTAIDPVALDAIESARRRARRAENKLEAEEFRAIESANRAAKKQLYADWKEQLLADSKKQLLADSK